jgi:hypothetical protein
MTDEHRERILTNLGRPTVLIDGFVRGTWKTEQTREKATLVFEPFERLPEKDRDALTPRRGEQLVRFVAGPEGTEAVEVRFDEKPREPPSVTPQAESGSNCRLLWSAVDLEALTVLLHTSGPYCQALHQERHQSAVVLDQLVEEHPVEAGG